MDDTTQDVQAQAADVTPHPVDEAAAGLPQRHQDAFQAMKDWVEERFRNLGGGEALKEWVRHEIELAAQGHSVETRRDRNP